jgi:uncharacterized OsmC-like protein
MAEADRRRSVTVSRTDPGRFRATNVRGGSVEFGTGQDGTFTPVELLLAAIGGCSGIDVDILTRRRAEPDSFEVAVEADSVRDEDGNHLENVTVTFSVRFPSGEDGDAARAVLPGAVQRSHDRLCTVSRTVERATEVSVDVAN